ncbi:hypothetical protein [Prevotellamassilia timonensis]|uniref:hypothetical protein n=1 Tax=Prevotellamassilia timonensis TaxID=1852370 RepID=UPI003079239C
MAMIGAAIGAGLKIGGSIFGGIKMSKAIKKMKAQINNQLKDNQNWYDRRYNEDATQRADAQALLTRTEESIRNRNAAAAGAQAVMGGTEESVAAAKEANNKALSDAVTNIAVNADARKDQIEQQYMNKKGELQDKLNNLTMQGAQNTAQAVNGVASVGNDIAGILDK